MLPLSSAAGNQEPETRNQKPAIFKSVLADASIRAKGAKALAKADGVEAFFVNAYGKGKAVLFNVNLASYAFLNDRGELGGVRDVVAKLYALGAGPAKFSAVTADGKPVTGIRYTRYVRDAAEYVGVEKVGMACEKFPMKAFVKIGAKKHVYDVRKGTYVGFVDAIPVTFEGIDIALFATLPYAVKGVAVEAPKAIARGEALAVKAQVQPGNPESGTMSAKPGTHVLRVEFVPPSGESPERFSPVHYQLCDAKGGQLEAGIQTAFNDEAGDWTLIVTDVATGVVTKQKVSVR